ncbi:GerMN domain-containing protein [Bacillus marinisedimentorum]|uniref:GerMN domain-containing protein n=1 Tax=Bacillus marinisedimentorum TaxID=1821260 RepID=UPI0007DF4CA2|nr:GerMN domain-containing protein [Bacillus marinisedimentorum]
MLKKRKAGWLILFFAFTLLLSGCMFDGERALNEIDPPKDVTYEETEASLEETEGKEKNAEEAAAEGEAAETVDREVFLLDQNGYVVPTTLAVPKTKEVAKQALEYLIAGGPVENMLPNGFRAVLPADTRVLGVNLLEDGTIVADFSTEFSNYKAEDEEKILQSITWTLTQFDKVDKVKIRINGYDQNEMPVNGTPITDGYSRANGINMDDKESVDITSSKAVTLYFLAQNEDNTYFVPMTKRVKQAPHEDMAAVAVNELIKGPSFRSGLLSDFHTNVRLLNRPTYEKGVVSLEFNDSILGDQKGTALSEDVLNSLVLSLTEIEGVDGVEVTVKGKEEIMDEKGEPLTKPVMRPERVNIGSF